MFCGYCVNYYISVDLNLEVAILVWFCPRPSLTLIWFWLSLTLAFALFWSDLNFLWSGLDVVLFWYASTWPSCSLALTWPVFAVIHSCELGNPCLHSGRCVIVDAVPNANNFLCQCPRNYRGVFCESCKSLTQDLVQWWTGFLWFH